MYGGWGAVAVVRALLSPTYAGTSMPLFVSDNLIPASVDLSVVSISLASGSKGSDIRHPAL